MAKYRATFLKREKWWVGWTDDVPGALTQGKTLREARDNLRDAIALMLEDLDTSDSTRVGQALVHEDIEV